MLPNRQEDQSPHLGNDDRAETEPETPTRDDDDKGRDQVDAPIPDQLQDAERARRARKADETHKPAT